jgi:hypothetical protein
MDLLQKYLSEAKKLIEKLPVVREKDKQHLYGIITLLQVV